MCSITITQQGLLDSVKFTVCVQYFTTGRASTFRGCGCGRSVRHSTLATGTCIKCDESTEMLYRRWYCPYRLSMLMPWIFFCVFFSSSPDQNVFVFFDSPSIRFRHDCYMHDDWPLLIQVLNSWAKRAELWPWEKICSMVVLQCCIWLSLQFSSVCLWCLLLLGV